MSMAISMILTRPLNHQHRLLPPPQPARSPSTTPPARPRPFSARLRPRRAAWPLWRRRCRLTAARTPPRCESPSGTWRPLGRWRRRAPRCCCRQRQTTQRHSWRRQWQSTSSRRGRAARLGGRWMPPATRLASAALQQKQRAMSAGAQRPLLSLGLRRSKRYFHCAKRMISYSASENMSMNRPRTVIMMR